MKQYIGIFFLLLTIGLHGQSTDRLGRDNNSHLTVEEAEYLNNEFKDIRKDFDFSDKKVAFITGTSGNRWLTKTGYFGDVKSRINANQTMVHFPIFLTIKEKNTSGDYDVIIAAWVKVLTDARKEKIIAELKAGSR
jgi:hypothetical protein